uniref:Uncharacterized protein n=1 Tax=Arundo donax TaxID=35708 RepID=A0A0A9CEV8_ARUDO
MFFLCDSESNHISRNNRSEMYVSEKIARPDNFV